MADTTFAALSARNADLIRKSLDLIAFVAPISSGVPTSLTAGASGTLQTLPTGFTDVGWMDASNAVNATNSPTASPVDSFGSLYPTRSDITKVNQTVAITCQETKGLTMGLYSQVDPASIKSDPTSGEIAWSDPVRPSTLFYRLMLVWTDLAGADTIFGGDFYPRVNVTGLADRKRDPGINADARGLTFTAYPDPVVGYAHRNFLGGPGIKNRLTAMGIAVGTGS